VSPELAVWAPSKSASTLPSLAEIVNFGHSFVTGTGGTAIGARAVSFGSTPSSGNGYTQRVARDFSCREGNKGFGGSLVQTSDTGGWREVAQLAIGRVRARLGSLAAWAQVISNDWGVNEPGADIPGMVIAYRAVLCMERLGARFQSADASVSTVGGTLQSANLIYTGDRVIGFNANGNTVTDVVPASFPGGEVDLFFIGSDTKGGILSFTVDGVAAGTLDIRTTTLKVGKFCLAVMRLPGLSAGAHTIVSTLSSMNVGGGPYHDSWGVLAPVPPLAIINGVTPTGAKFTAPNRQTALNTALASLAAEFPAAEVKFYDRDALIPDQATFDAFMNDGTHPTDEGHGMLAKGLVDLISASTYPTPTIHATG
jgi:hypothetical protein